MGFGKDGKGVIIQEGRSQALLTLASSTGLVIGTKLANTTAFRMLKVEGQAIVTAITPGEGIGMELWLVDGDLTLAEFEESIEFNGPLNKNDIVGADTVMRPAFYAGSFDGGVADTTLVLRDKKSNAPGFVLNPRWTFNEDSKGWNWIIYNSTGSNLSTGATVRIHIRDFGVWVGQ